ncbi:thioesterase [Alkalilimnicola ehrlichii]|uniref:Thioesterase n=1 Tax=Alkalilimnicola ehrlichii TaxID=351052 RepID=A0A3E0WVR0_9GAMM|nr:thioesterase family protein [Alkalilimnicola ehrlichii]RFA29172.1 thioesterase [Alkalilimnicola ehrlichii]RFA36085.1 thioesterase [Alkalilimnicola ehrlichii]
MSALNWKLPPPYILPVTVTEADIDEFGHTNNVVYLGWLEQVAWGHSKDLGLSIAEYRELGFGLVARKHELEYLLPTFAGDELLVGTWISGNDGRLSVFRDYQIIRPRDGKTVLTGSTHWVCVDMESGRARRLPQVFVDAYRPESAPV